MIQNRKHQWKFLAFILVVLLLGCMPAEADPLYDGFIVSPWVYEGITYYRVYSNPEEIMGAPTFYTEERDQYNNIYTNWDVKITFYRQYDGATLEQADAFCQYLMANSSEKNRYAGYYYYGDSYSPEIFVYLFEGWDFNNLDLDFQDFWDRNPWMNGDATALVLEYLGYGLSDATWQQAWKMGCSSAVCVQANDAGGFPGVAFGFHFKEGTDSHTVRRYCPGDPLG